MLCVQGMGVEVCTVFYTPDKRTLSLLELSVPTEDINTYHTNNKVNKHKD